VPADARVTGADAAPWGSRHVEVARTGYVAERIDLEVPRPDRCEDAVFRPERPVTLQRAVTVVVRDDTGAAIVPSSLVVDGEVVSPAGFRHVPGPCAYVAEAPGLGRVEGRASIDACAADTCAPALLDVRFPAPKHTSSRGPALVMGLGGVLIAGGLVSGAAAYSTQQRIDAYDTRAKEGYSVDSLLDRRHEQALTADALVGLGATTFVSGLVWHLLTGGGP
jgi:hypothetical protein